MKRTKIKLISRWFDLELSLSLPSAQADELLSKENPIECINEDIDRIKAGHEGRYISASQATKITTYFAKGSHNYFCDVIAD